MEVDGCSKHDHEGELEEEDAIEDEGLGFAPCFQPLGYNVGAGVDGESGETRDCNRRELHCRESLAGGSGAEAWGMTDREASDKIEAVQRELKEALG